MQDLTADQERRLASLIAVYPVADEVARLFADAGHELYLVGGTVRDTLLDRAHSDLDFATSASPSQSAALLRQWVDTVWETGARFGTVSARRGHWTLEITTFRAAETYTPGSRHPQVVFGADIESDLSRRDFTINAMAVRLPEHRFVDPFKGLRDLRARLLRTPVDPKASFSDDPLRMVRLARFVAQLDAKVDHDTRTAATELAPALDSISRERIRDEFNKLILAAKQRKGIDLLCDTGLADRFIPEIPALRMERDPLHRHKEVYTHTLAVVDRCPNDDLVLRLAALLHDIGKPATRAFGAGGKVTFHHHEVVGARTAQARLQELRYERRIIDDVVALVRNHLRFHGYSDRQWTDSAVRRYVHAAGSREQLRRLNTLTRADVTTRNRAKARRLAAAMNDLEQRIDRLDAEEELRAIRPALDGRQIMAHLGLAPGPLVGEARSMLLDARLERGPMTEEEAYALLDAWASQKGVARE